MSVDITLEEFTEKIKSIQTPDKVWEALMGYVASFGIDALSYYHIAPPGSLDFSEKYFLAIGFEEDLAAEHRRNHDLFSSPFTSHSNPVTEPIFWPQAYEKLNLTPKQQEHLNKFYCQNSANGLVLPVYGPNSRNGCVVLRFADPLCRFSRLSIHAVNFAAYHAHLHFCRLRAKNQKNVVHLTQREQEVLTWVARGKSNSVIADIVGISQHTVNGYLRRIYLKTQTSDRTSAALRAIGDSLIDF